MKRMIYFEWKKIWNRKFNLIAMATGYLLIIFCALSLIMSASFYEDNTESYVHGVKAFALARVQNEQMLEYVTEEYVTNLVREVKAYNIALDSDEGYIKVIRPKFDILLLICNNYMRIGEWTQWETLNKVPTNTGIGFYDRRVDKVAEYLNMDFSFGNYSEEEKTFWMEKMEQVKTPFLWGDKSSMDTMWSSIQIGFYLVFVIAICISPVFASEYETGAATLLFTTKYGKNKMIYAKIFAAVLFGFCYCMIGILLGLFLIGSIVGFHGSELPIQLWSTEIPYNWSILKTCIVTMLILILITLAVTMFTLFISSCIKGSIATLVVIFLTLIGPAFLPMSKSSGIWNHINYLFPIRVVAVKDVLKVFNSYQIGNQVISYLTMIGIVYLTVIVLSVLGVVMGKRTMQR